MTVNRYSDGSQVQNRRTHLKRNLSGPHPQQGLAFLTNVSSTARHLQPDDETAPYRPGWQNASEEFQESFSL